MRAGDCVALELTVTNTGQRAGSDVVRVYVEPPADSPVFRPRRELKAFAKIAVDAQEQQRLTIELDWRSFAYWTPEGSAVPYHDPLRATPFASTVPHRVPPAGWTVQPGRYVIHVGRSISDIDASVPLTVEGCLEGER